MTARLIVIPRFSWREPVLPFVIAFAAVDAWASAVHHLQLFEGLAESDFFPGRHTHECWILNLVILYNMRRGLSLRHAH